MIVKHMRIDDRLIHGQIVTAWIKESKASTILVADDMAANDATQKMLLQLVTPKSVKLELKTLEDASAYLLSETNQDEIFIIVRNAKSARYLFDNGLELKSLNVGNISNSKSTTGRTKFLAYIYLEEQDKEHLKAIADKGIQLDVRAVPTDRSIDGRDFLK